jgi:hypothetical protein
MIDVYKANELCSKLLMNWTFLTLASPEFRGNDPELISGGDPLSSILYKKLEWAGLNINIPNELFLIMSICSRSPGGIQVLCHELLSSIENLHQGYTITPNDFCKLYPTQFPIFQIDKWQKHFDKEWEKQKIKDAPRFASDNQCDTKEYWLSLLQV